MEVIRTKSTASMAFPLSLANFLVALEWAFYGHIVMDNFVKVSELEPETGTLVYQCATRPS